jgi:putative YhbY family RNA-binding protein
LWNKETISHFEGTTFHKKELKRLQSRSHLTSATVWIGKQGPSEDLAKQVATQLKKRELVKVKIQKSALTTVETKAIAHNVALLTGSTLIEVIGHTFTLYKKRESKVVGE